MFLCEFVTGGGLHGNPLLSSLAAEGRLMRDALARDLNDFPEVELLSAVDGRIPPPAFGAVRTIADRDDPWTVWAEMAATADIAWIVAPETGGVLRRLAALCRAAGARTLGPDDEAIRVASSKRLTAAALSDAGVRTPATWLPDAIPTDQEGPFVSKPDDGAGCDATRFWRRRPPSDALPAGHVVQPYVAGEPISLTLLKTGGRVSVLTANRQDMRVTQGVFAFDGVTVGALDRENPATVDFAATVAAALPGLDGMFGIDAVASPDGLSAIDVNPRLTTAYAGLRDALGYNPLQLMPDFCGEAPTRTRPPLRAVEVRP